MPSNITLITLGVEGVAEATAFYERLGFVKSKRASEESVSFFKAGGVVLALWSREAQREDGQAGAIWNGNGGIAVAQNVASEGEVDAVMARAKAAGAQILKQAAKTLAALTVISPTPTGISGRLPLTPNGAWIKTA
jgi:uncharacterized protein